MAQPWPRGRFDRARDWEKFHTSRELFPPARRPAEQVDCAARMTTIDWQARAVSPEDAARAIPNGARVFVHGAAATPTPLLDALVDRADLEGVTLYHLHTSGPARFAAAEAAGRMRSVSFFVGAA